MAVCAGGGAGGGVPGWFRFSLGEDGADFFLGGFFFERGGDGGGKGEGFVLGHQFFFGAAAARGADDAGGGLVMGEIRDLAANVVKAFG